MMNIVFMLQMNIIIDCNLFIDFIIKLNLCPNEYILNYTDNIVANISSPLLAEMIINFSYFIGPIIFFIFGLLAGLFDYKYKLERSVISKIRLKKKDSMFHLH